MLGSFNTLGQFSWGVTISPAYLPHTKLTFSWIIQISYVTQSWQGAFSVTTKTTSHGIFLSYHWRKIPGGQEMVAVLWSLPGDLVTLADRLVLPPVLPLTGPAAVGHFAAAPTRTCLPWATHVTGAHIKARWGTLDNLKSGFMSASDETQQSVMEDGQKFLAKVKSEGK